MGSSIDAAVKMHAERLPAAAREMFAKYWALLHDWSEAVNLTGCSTEEEFADLFIRDPFVMLEFEDQLGPGALIDIGTGAGNPGISLAIAWPDRPITLVDSRQRRCAFLRHATAALGLPNARVIEERVESLARDANHREQYRVATARAFGPAPWAVECCTPFVRSGGSACLFLSTADATRLVQNAGALRELGLGDPTLHRVVGGDRGKALVRIPKISLTPEIFPRREKQAQKSPLY